MTFMPWDGPKWFAELWPDGMSFRFGPGDAPELTLIEAAVMALAGPGRFNWSDAAIRETTGLSAEELAAVKRSLQEKYEAWQRNYWEVQKGRKILHYGQLFTGWLT